MADILVHVRVGKCSHCGQTQFGKIEYILEKCQCGERNHIGPQDISIVDIGTMESELDSARKEVAQLRTRIKELSEKTWGYHHLYPVTSSAFAFDKLRSVLRDLLTEED